MLLALSLCGHMHYIIILALYFCQYIFFNFNCHFTSFGKLNKYFHMRYV